MENASKALIIAGAILLVIAIIAIAVGIVSRTRGVIDTAGNQIDSMAIEMHNKQFEIYDKGTISGYEAKELVATVLSNNNNTKNKDFQVYLEVYTDKCDTILWIYRDGSIDVQNKDTGEVTEEEDTSAITEWAKKYKCSIRYLNGIVDYIKLDDI